MVEQAANQLEPKVDPASHCKSGSLSGCCHKSAGNFKNRASPRSFRLVSEVQYTFLSLFSFYSRFRVINVCQYALLHHRRSRCIQLYSSGPRSS
jgi:hypothetical protein